jgi:4-diphosphocytidyl-2-C-methyl-D-erythritol kinase
MEGRGELVSATCALPPLEIVLVNPGVALSTASVFAALNARTGTAAMKPPVRIGTLWELVAYLGDAGNDLEAPATRLQPVIDEVLEALHHEPACVFAQMSGSGATCFGLFDGSEFAHGAADRIAHDHPTWWVRATRLAAPDIGVPR